MADLPAESSTVTRDEPYKEFRRSLIADYATKFDAWIERDCLSTGYTGPVPGTLADIARGFSEHMPHLLKRVAAQTGGVYELARMCRDFITGDLYSWAFLHIRHGASVDQAMQAATSRIDKICSQTHGTRWRVGLRCLPRDRWFTSFGNDESWIQNAWTVVVEESLTDFMQHCLRPALERGNDERELAHRESKTVELERQIRALSREWVERLRVEVHAQTGVKITNRDIARVAGYKDETPVKWFLANDPRLKGPARAKVTAILNLLPAEFVTRLCEKKPVQRSAVYTIREAARLLHTSDSTVRGMIKAGKLRSVLVGARRHIPCSDIKNLAQTPKYLSRRP